MGEGSTPLPPFAGLRAFHAAARRGRFKDAADDLGITESGISHQVRRLEEFLGVALFDRSSGRMTLTPVGERYFESIDPAVGQIREATAEILGPSDRKRVTLTVPPSLASLWLIPNMGSFEANCSGIDLQLITTARICDLRRDQIDLAIRHGHGDWPGLESVFMFEQPGFPVCAPGYLDTAAEKDLQTALADSRIIVNSLHPEEWTEWAMAHGLEPPSTRGALVLSDFGQVLEAAERGLGLAIGRRPMVDERCTKGTLVAPFGSGSAPTAAAYYLCRPGGMQPTAAARKVHRWLTNLAEQQRASTPQL